MRHALGTRALAQKFLGNSDAIFCGLVVSSVSVTCHIGSGYLKITAFVEMGRGNRKGKFLKNGQGE